MYYLASLGSSIFFERKNKMNKIEKLQNVLESVSFNESEGDEGLDPKVRKSYNAFLSGVGKEGFKLDTSKTQYIMGPYVISFQIKGGGKATLNIQLGFGSKRYGIVISTKDSNKSKIQDAVYDVAKALSRTTNKDLKELPLNLYNVANRVDGDALEDVFPKVEISYDTPF